MRKHILAMFLLLVVTPATSFAWTITSQWKTENEAGWSCIDRTGGGLFPGVHHTIESPSGIPVQSNALRINYPSGWPMTSEPTHCWKSFPEGVTEVWVQYYVRYSPNWYMGEGNKHIFITLQTGGNFFVSVGGSRRIYIKTQSEGSAWASTPITGAPLLQNGNWYKVKGYFKTNTPGSYDGVGRLWVNDVLAVNHSNIRYITTPGNMFQEVTITPVVGGGGTKPAEDSVWFAYPIVSTTQIEGGNVPPDPADLNQIPKPPSNLSIQ